MDSTAKRDILIVDDDLDTREIIKIFVKDLGYVPHTATDGTKAIEALKAKDFGILISDLVMPNLDGIQLLERMTSEGIDTPVILLTGYGSESYARKALSLGAFDFLEKPFNAKSLKIVIDQASKREQVAGNNLGRFRVFEGMITKAFAEIDNHLSKPSPNLTYEQKLKVISAAYDQLSFCKTSLDQLPKSEVWRYEASYLLRIMHGLTIKFLSCGLVGLALLTSTCKKYLIYLRTQPRGPTETSIFTLKRTILSLLEHLETAKKSSSNSNELLRLEEQLKLLCNQLMNNPTF